MNKTINSATELKRIVEVLHQGGLNMTPEGMAYAAKTEEYIQQSYEGRSLFELIQNARDANQLAGKAGAVWFELKETVLTVANTGLPFSEAGIVAVSRVGESTKHSAETIGFKGIGFKSVRQLTDRPRVVTQHGTFYFDESETRRSYANSIGKGCPLFLLPYYLKAKLSKVDLAQGIVTRVELPLRDETATQWVHRNFTELKIEQLLLLDWLTDVSFTTTQGHNRRYHLRKDRNGRSLTTKVDDQPEKHFRLYTPRKPVSIPLEVMAGLGEKEKALVSAMEQVDIRIVLGANTDGSYRPIPDAALYLFYPLGLKTGFSFIIHSYFLVSPSRTELRADAKLNTFLLEEIGRYIGGELLQRLKKVGWDTNEVLCYNREEEKLRVLHNSVRDTLRNQSFIYCEGEYLQAADVMTISASLADRLLLQQFDGKRLVVASEKVRDWLSSEFGVRELNRKNLEAELEKECERRRQTKDWPFFDQFYRYLSAKDAPDMSDRAVLLTQHQLLVCGKKVNIFYIARSQRNTLDLPIELADAVQMLHKRFSFPNEGLRLFQGRTGLRDFERASLASALLERMGPQKPLNWELLGVLYSMRDEVSAEDFQSEGVVPTSDGQWVNPIHTPVYLASKELRALYSKRGKYLEKTVFERLKIGANEKQEFMQWAGIWRRPGMYVQRNERTLHPNDSRHPRIGWNQQLSRRNIELRRERTIDEPENLTSWFATQLLHNWSSYRYFLQKDIDGKNPEYYQNNSYYQSIQYDSRVTLSGAAEWLRKKSWLRTQLDEVEGTFSSIGEVVFVGDQDHTNALDRAVVQYLPVVAVPSMQLNQLALDLGAVTWPSTSGSQFVSLLKLFYAHNEARLATLKANEAEKLKRAYNHVLTRLYEATLGRGEEVPDGLESVHFLAINGLTGELSWCEGEEVNYIDDPALYEQLPPDWQAVLQPQFTRVESNQFGKIAKQVGKRLTEALNRKVVFGELQREFTLAKLMGHNLVGLLALMEQKMDEALTDQEVVKLTDIKVHEVESLERVLWWDNDEQNEHHLTLTHFVGEPEDGEAVLWVTTNFGKRPAADIASALVQIAQERLDKTEVNWVHVQATLEDYLDLSHTTEFLKRHHVGRERMLELEQFLQTAGSSLIAFWRAVGQAIGSPIPEEATTLDEATLNLSLSRTLLAQLAPETFRYSRLSDSGNRKALLALLKVLRLPFSTLQNVLEEPIIQEELWGNEWKKMLTKYQAAFQAWQYERLSEPPITKEKRKRQQGFSKQLEKYKLLPARPYPSALTNSLETHFERVLRDNFHELADISVLKQQEEKPAQWYNDLFRQALLVLQKQVPQEEHAWLDDFLSGSQLRDLLYFGHTEPIMQAYEIWAAPQRVISTTTGNNEGDTDAEHPDPYRNPAGIFRGTANMRATAPAEESSPDEQWRSSGGGGGGMSGAANNENNTRVGLRAEQRVLSMLAEQHEQVRWLSYNAKDVGANDKWYNPDGDDRLGYDISYRDSKTNEEVRVEVKGTTGEGGRFFISQKEVQEAGKKTSPYRLLYVTNAEDDDKAQIHDLQNPFSNGLKSLHENPAFTPMWQKMQISFTLSTDAEEQ
ncbi:DUF3883 domain-containing protein [Hymenobacter sp. BT189]|uniref:DUF3883 domain-containing protein n=2 Tax=Hymenobacter armeniacus TaxID=2771358 RepID=A0ABR8JRH1_9BACT|nr:DUF3883 domain-containing protein [Hymenobacter armeniacus]